MMELYMLKMDSMEDPLLHPEWKDLIAEYRWRQIHVSSCPDFRCQSAAAGLLLSYVLKKRGIKNMKTGFSIGVHGKPVHTDLCFNLSHSGKYILCAASSALVGCDVQKIKLGNDRLMQRFFSTKEREYVFSAENQSDKERRFTKIWSLKESVVKMSGEGFLKGNIGLSIDMNDPVRVYRYGAYQPIEIYIQEQEDYIITACGKEAVHQIFKVRWQELFSH